jgi:hypothetical protein
MTVVFAVAALSLVGSSGAAAAAQAPATRTIASGAVVADAIRDGAVQEFVIDARAGDAIDVTVTQKGVDLVLVVRDPNGATLQEVDSPNGAEGDETTTALAGASGTYRIQLRPLEPNGGGNYELRAQVRAATRRDRDRAEAEAALRAAPGLLGSGSASDVDRASRDLTRALPKAIALGDADLTRAVASRLLGVDTAAVFAAFDVPALPGPVPVYYSRGQEARAAGLRDALVRTIDHFAAALKVRARLSLAVLTRADWERVTGTMYGMPFSYVDRAPLIVVPAEHVMFAEMLGKMVKEDGPAGTVARAAAETSLPLSEVTRRFGDSIVHHELGHILVAQYGIVPPNRWFGEFLANFVMQAYLGESGDDPRLLRFFEVFKARQRSQPVTHRALDDLERLYAGVGPDNYGWYQAQTDARALEVFKAHGLAFLPRVKATFPVGTPGTLPVAEVLSKLDAIAPGFTAWALRLERPEP